MTQHRGGSGNFAEDKQKASEAGKKGGQHSGGNFKNDREKASEAGKKGRSEQQSRLVISRPAQDEAAMAQGARRYPPDYCLTLR
jgi:Stress-induced bacterial acidophilic repeat motif.